MAAPAGFRCPLLSDLNDPTVCSKAAAPKTVLFDLLEAGILTREYCKSRRGGRLAGHGKNRIRVGFTLVMCGFLLAPGGWGADSAKKPAVAGFGGLFGLGWLGLDCRKRLRR